MTQLHDLPALEQARAVRRREVSPVELVDHYLDRVDRLDPRLGAFVTVTADAARAQAKQAEQAIAAGDRLPLLHGVPLAIKDLSLTAGVRTSFGCPVFADFVPPVDDYLVGKLRAAGTISLGKTNTPEIGLPCYTHPDPSVAPVARNPWDTTRYSGGSSGGAAAAVAAGLLPFAHGSDGGGSIRIPASLCGLVGIKPSRGRVSAGPVRADVTGLSIDGPIARTVRDAAALLDALAGPMPGDLWSAGPAREPGSFLAAADRDPGTLRIGRYLTPSVAEVEVDEDVVEGYEAASRLLAGLGHEVEDVQPPFGPDLVPAFETLWSVSACAYPIDPAAEDTLLPLTRYLRERGRRVTATEFVQARQVLQVASWMGSAALARYDVLLAPVVSAPAPLVGWFFEDGEGEADFERQKQFAPYTAVYNVTGHPAASVPVHWTDSGLPVGMMLVGRHHDEATLITLAAQLEDATGWPERHPAMW
jgi:amidase